MMYDPCVLYLWCPTSRIGKPYFCLTWRRYVNIHCGPMPLSYCALEYLVFLCLWPWYAVCYAAYSAILLWFNTRYTNINVTKYIFDVLSKGKPVDDGCIIVIEVPCLQCWIWRFTFPWLTEKASCVCWSCEFLCCCCIVLHSYENTLL